MAREANAQAHCTCRGCEVFERLIEEWESGPASMDAALFKARDEFMRVRLGIIRERP